MPETLPRKDSPVFEQEYTPVRDKSQTDEEEQEDVREEMEQQYPRPYEPMSNLKRLVFLLKACEPYLRPETDGGPLRLAIRVLSGCSSTRSFSSVQRYLAPVQEVLTRCAQDFILCHRTEPGTSLKKYSRNGRLIRRVFQHGAVKYKVRDAGLEVLLERQLMGLFARPHAVDRDVMRIIDMILRTTRDDYERSLVSMYDVTVRVIPFRHFYSEGDDSLISRYFDFRMYATNDERCDFFTTFLERVNDLCDDVEDPGPWQEGEEPWPGRVAARFLHNVSALDRDPDIDSVTQSSLNVEAYARTTHVPQVQVRFFLSELIHHIRRRKRYAFAMGHQPRDWYDDALGRDSNSSLVRSLSTEVVQMICRLSLGN